ncbi:MAG TPA: response regulator [Candidatus Sulfomarinibacteraceae bacterium]|nr:response regulator [Candidatus Sulfomarinibacteraceae bacterium]
MSLMSVVSATFSGAEKILEGVLERTGLPSVDDAALAVRAAERSGMSEAAIVKAFSARPSVFNSFTRDRERAVAHLKVEVAEAVARDGLVISGFCALLVPESVSHALRICLVADLYSRLELAKRVADLGDKAATREIRRHDEDLAAWAKDHRGSDDPWAPSLYDIVLPTDKTPAADAVALIVESLGRQAVQPTEASRRAVEDFLVAARVERELAAAGHHVGVACSRGHVTLTINKHVLMLGRLEDELKEIAGPVEGVRGVETRVGRDFYQTDIYRKVDFETPSRVLLVDDEREFVQTLSERLEMRDVGSAVAYDGESALQMVEQDEPDVMILDLKMPGIDGIEVLRRVKDTNPHIEVIILTGHGSDQDCKTCMELGAFAYLQKPVDIEALSETLRKANEKAKESARLRARKDDRRS